MEKIFKKSLALVLSAALCLTALLGCLTVSAEGEIVAGNYALSTDVKGKAGDNVDVFADYTDINTICAHYVAVTFPENFTVNGVYKAKETADGEAYELLKAYSADSGDNWQYKLDTVDGKTVIESCDIINFFASEGNSENITNASLKFKFNVTIGDVEAGDYPVTVEVKQAATQEEEWVAPTCTNGKITVVTDVHEHTWNDGVMTTMPTTTSNGVITYTCECGETKTEDFVVDGTISTNQSKTGVVVNDLKVQYGVTITAAVFADLKNKEATEIAFGMLLTRDGSEPTVKDGITPIYKYTGNIPAGKNATANGYFQGMNLTQMGQTLNFRAYVQFTLKGQVCYYYGEVYSNVFIDSIRSNTDAQSVALVSLYDNKSSATNISVNCTGTTVDVGSSDISTNASKTMFDLTAIKVQYGSTFSANLFSTIKEAGGTGISFGLLLSRDNSIPSFENGSTPIYEYTGNIPAGKNGSANGYFQGMNFTQMGQTLTFRPFVKYTNADGTVVYEYGSAVSFVYIDILKTVAGDNAYANELLSYYNAYVAK